MPAPVRVDKLSKSFDRTTIRRRQTVREFISRLRQKTNKAEPVEALRNVSFTVDSGEALGIIGSNGSGKSTLLRLIGGVGQPDEGIIDTHGRYGALLELGTGSNENLSGRDNIIIGGVIAGMSINEAKSKVDDIARFAEIEDCLDNPLRTYSAGMQMRLAFAVIVYSEPEILLVDEVLAVGDLAFQNKCIERINELRQRGCCVLLASHDLEQITEVCDRALWLEHGEQRMLDAPEKVVQQYRQRFAARTAEITPGPDQSSQFDKRESELLLQKDRMGSQEIQIDRVLIESHGGEELASFASGEPMVISIDYTSKIVASGLIFGVTVANEDGRICLDLNSGAPNADRQVSPGPGCATLRISSIDLRPGAYSISVGLYERSWEHAYDYHWNAYSLEVIQGSSRNRTQTPSCQWNL